jgi:hypothetical protein
LITLPRDKKVKLRIDLKKPEKSAAILLLILRFYSNFKASIGLRFEAFLAG